MTRPVGLYAQPKEAQKCRRLAFQRALYTILQVYRNMVMVDYDYSTEENAYYLYSEILYLYQTNFSSPCVCVCPICLCIPFRNTKSLLRVRLWVMHCIFLDLCIPFQNTKSYFGPNCALCIAYLLDLCIPFRNTKSLLWVRLWVMYCRGRGLTFPDHIIA